MNFTEVQAEAHATRARLDAIDEAKKLCDSLSERQRAVLVLLSKGLGRREAGVRLHMAEGTVADHAKRIFTVLGVNSAIEAAVIATKAGLV